jgi:hypothetical protein
MDSPTRHPYTHIPPPPFLPPTGATTTTATTATEAKRAAFDAFLGKGLLPSFQAGSPYGVLAGIVEDMLGASILDLLIDEEDSPRGPGITFGPLLLLQEALPDDRFRPRTKNAGGGGGLRSQVVDCLLDEVVGLSLELGRGIGMPEDLYEGTCVSWGGGGQIGIACMSVCVIIVWVGWVIYGWIEIGLALCVVCTPCRQTNVQP